MKTILLGLAVFSSLSAPASANALTCNGSAYGAKFEVIAGNLSKVENRVLRLTDVRAAYTYKNYLDQPTTELGNAKYLVSDINYNPTKYKDHVRFDFSKLENKEDRTGRFLPQDMCNFYVMIPLNATSVSSFEAPVTMNCDQGGGKIVLTCKTGNTVGI